MNGMGTEMLNCTGMFPAFVADLARAVQRPKPRQHDPLAAARAAKKAKDAAAFEETQSRIYRAIAANPRSTRVELKEITEIGLELLRVHLVAMETAGKIKNISSKYRPEYVVEEK